MDINVFDPVGVNQNAMRFTEAFVIYCMLQESPAFDEQSWQEATRNHSQTANQGRNPEFRLLRDGKEVGLREWSREIIEDVRAIAEIIDRGEGGDAYVQAVDAQSVLIENSDETPSARILEELRRSGTGFFDFAMQCAIGHKDYFLALADLNDERLQLYEKEAAESLERQRAIEASDDVSFDEFLDQYFSDQGCR
jgi:glutamate--cysteine ligase